MRSRNTCVMTNLLLQVHLEHTWNMFGIFHIYSNYIIKSTRQQCHIWNGIFHIYSTYIPTEFISVGFQLEISNWIPTEIQMNWKRPNIEMCSSHMFLGFSITIPTTCGYPITQNIHLAVHRHRVADLDVGQAIHIHDAVGLRHVHQGVNV